ncbi:tripartite tricarboxylate transporter substrate binding protein [Acidovorax sp.]|jgi:tripartite-type tricarboxylate transporter receptor subunit TctC|uniref:Bug family tripartite tricarboxylate transporter substrate binding protein n=1 Tax=Acidovorax sp. TaxID=1872122 RepID=UPI0025C2D2C9|nr:tripartite tricarboxylate transporter substrate binding protein [Acidovorax sp.]MCI5067524.1 tripartite tricarboxylate transporter substrate binding protein [Acidovorax sp.]
MLNRRYATGLLAALALAAGPSAVLAQSYPAKPIRWVVPYPAGGGSDFLARTIGQQLATQISQTVTVDNKPGANTAIAAVDVARSPADGYTILSADNGTMVFNSALYSKLTYNPDKDLVPVTLMGRFPMILVVGPNSDIRDAKDFVAKAKAAPGKLSYGSAGAGSPHHLAMELLKVNSGLHMVHIPYRGAAPALTDLAGGQVNAMMVDLAAGAGFIKGGKVRPLAVAHPTRLPQLPDVPTFAELGFKGVEASAQVGVVAPAGTPTDVVAALQKQVAAAINQPAIRQKLVDFGIEPVGSTPQQYSDLIRSEVQRWHKLIREQKISLD